MIFIAIFVIFTGLHIAVIVRVWIVPVVLLAFVGVVEAVVVGVVVVIGVVAFVSLQASLAMALPAMPPKITPPMVAAVLPLPLPN